MLETFLDLCAPIELEPISKNTNRPERCAGIQVWSRGIKFYKFRVGYRESLVSRPTAATANQCSRVIILCYLEPADWPPNVLRA